MVKKESNVSIFIITYNEDNDIQTCLESIKWSNDVVILDSYSTDNTLTIAESFNNVRIFQRKFDNYAEQRNYGLKNIDFLNPWVFIIDADETCPQELQKEILDISSLPYDGIIAYSVKRNIHFCGKALTHNSLYNVRVERLVKPAYVSFYGEIHEKLSLNGKSGELKHPLNHFPFSKGLDHWIQRRNTYSTLSANFEQTNTYPIVVQNAFSTNPIKRRTFFNALYRKLPFRWLIFFLYNFFIKLCFLDGVKGIRMVLLETYYEFLIVSKLNCKKG